MSLLAGFMAHGPKKDSPREVSKIQCVFHKADEKGTKLVILVLDKLYKVVEVATFWKTGKLTFHNDIMTFGQSFGRRVG